MLKRRGFLKGTGGITLGLACVGPLALFTAARQGHAAGFKGFSEKKFESMIGSWLHLDPGGGAGWESVQLVEVVDFPDSKKLEQFAIRLCTSPQLDLQPGVYTVDDGSEAFELYLEPAGSDSTGRYCTAWFSLIGPGNGP